MSTRTIKLDMISRVEGEGGLTLKVKDGVLTELKLHIFESPRFFEGILRGRRLEEAPDITSRICGICPVAYQISSASAMENALGIELPPVLLDLRRLILYGEWIESHMLHVHLLHAPDFLRYSDAIAMAKEHPKEVQRGLGLKQLGNRIVSVVGGREVHPVNIRVGGFYSYPSEPSMRELRADLAHAIDECESVVRWVSSFEFPDDETPAEFVAIRGRGAYPLLGGEIESSNGTSIPISGFDSEFEEDQLEHSTAMHSHRRNGDSYLVGPLARFHLSRGVLTPRAQALARECLPGGAIRNPYRSIVVRAIETLVALEGSLQIVESYEPTGAPNVGYRARAGVGFGCSEAPRGFCWHRYGITADGLIESARIVPPTSQNLAQIEVDLFAFASARLELPDEELKTECERAVRNHDPCISCSVHFLNMRIERS
ncbi:MAG: nickel-dependent hydrogenase large subunit [Fimbriimonas sp.]|nr:nickel-dependent hydrogenase large subunit [Fimbriimonas sp.]